MERLQTTVHISDASKWAQKEMSAVTEKRVEFPGLVTPYSQGKVTA
jgi:hypothetical protein